MSDDKKDICENMHIMDYGDIEDTLYNAGIGIWSIELHDDSEPCMYADKTMNMLLDIKIEHLSIGIRNGAAGLTVLIWSR